MDIGACISLDKRDFPQPSDRSQIQEYGMTTVFHCKKKRNLLTKKEDHIKFLRTNGIKTLL